MCAPTWRARLRQTGAFVAIALIAILLCATLRDLYPSIDAWLLKTGGRGWRNHDSLWMPRYIALIIPALFVLAAIVGIGSAYYAATNTSLLGTGILLVGVAVYYWAKRRQGKPAT